MHSYAIFPGKFGLTGFVQLNGCAPSIIHGISLDVSKCFESAHCVVGTSHFIGSYEAFPGTNKEAERINNMHSKFIDTSGKNPIIFEVCNLFLKIKQKIIADSINPKCVTKYRKLILNGFRDLRSSSVTRSPFLKSQSPIKRKERYRLRINTITGDAWVSSILCPHIPKPKITASCTNSMLFRPLERSLSRSCCNSLITINNNPYKEILC